MLEIKAAEDIKEKYEYDYMGNLTAATDGEGRRREYHRDIQGNTDRITYADGSVETYRYDAMARMVTKTYRSGKKEEYGYDIFGNPIKIEAEQECLKENSDSSEKNEKYTYEYNRDGRIKSASGGGIKYTYEYDECGRLKSKSACGRTLVKYKYDLNGNKTAVTDVTGKTTLYKYDLTDHLITISENNKILAEYSYTLCGKVSKIKCGDIITEYRYDLDGRKAEIKVTVSGNVISDIKYIYDASGNCIKKVNGAEGLNAVTEYSYDGIGRLTRVDNAGIIETYTYDHAGNRTSHTINGETTEKYSYNEVNELLSMERSTKHDSDNDIREFTYDSDGNMTSDGMGIYKYDSLNRMTEAVMEDGRKLICRYDAEGLRHETEENGRLIRFIYSGRDAVCEEEDDNITRYIRGNGRLVASDSENARTYYHYASDSLGSITHVIAGNEFGSEKPNDDINNRILCRYKYDAFGNTINEVETISNRYGFTGEMNDSITNMYYLRARYYAPNTGRFTQADTYHGDGLNLYVYAGNNPVKYVDPSGHDKENGIIVYRAVTPEQAMSIREGKGIVKPKPYARTNADQHVGGVKHKRNPWISTTRKLESARFFSTHGGDNEDCPNPIVRIDLSKIHADNILDISTTEKAKQHLKRPFTINAAAHHEEVLIYGDIPQEAIIGFIGGKNEGRDNK